MGEETAILNTGAADRSTTDGLEDSKNTTSQLDVSNLSLGILQH